MRAFLTAAYSVLMSSIAIAAGSQSTAGAPVTKQPPGDVPLAVISSIADVSQQTVTFTLQNTGTKVITAWNVAIAVGTEPETLHGGYGVDNFRQFAGLVEGHRYLSPGGTITTTAKMQGAFRDATPVVITPRVAVFDDTSFAGYEKFAQFVFDRRAELLDAWKDIQSRLETVRLAGPVNVTTLESLLSQVNATMDVSGPDIVRATFRANLLQAVDKVRAGKADPKAELDAFLNEARQNVEQTTAHSRRR